MAPKRKPIRKGTRRAVYRRDGFACTACHGRYGKMLTLHHVVPVAMGGTNHKDNLVTLCDVCHRAMDQ